MRKQNLPVTLPLILLVLSGCQTNSKPTAKGYDPASITPQIPFIQQQPLVFRETVRPGDRILFVGDELTQQMFYTRAVAAALIAMMPEADLRFFNGGKEGATAASAKDWIDDLLVLTRPTLVFVCVGLNDVTDSGPVDKMMADYKYSLADLIDRIKPSVERLVVISTPAVDSGEVDFASDTPVNGRLRQLAEAAKSVAEDLDVGFVDVFVPMRRVYIAAARLTANHPVGFERLTINGRLPNEQGHVVLASTVLYGIGVLSADLDPVGWSPVIPQKMRLIRGALGLALTPPSLDAAQRSRALYQSMISFDERFFRIWRLAPRGQATRSPHQVAEVESAWIQVSQASAAYEARSKVIDQRSEVRSQ